MRPTVVTHGLGDALLVTRGFGGSVTIGFLGWTEGQCIGATWSEGGQPASAWTEATKPTTIFGEAAKPTTAWTEATGPGAPALGSPAEWKEGGI